MMNFLTQILAVDVPANTTLQSADLSFRGLTLAWFILLALLVLFGMIAVGFFYLLEKGTLGWGRRIVLIGLRCTLLALLMFLILRPVLLAEFVGERPQGIALLIDSTQSMELRDQRLKPADEARVATAKGTPALPPNAPKDPSRMEMVKYVLENPQLHLLDDLQQFGPLRPYFFGSDLRGVPDDGKKKPLLERILAGYKAEESQTALADSIVKILEAKDHNDLPSAIVVMTDGQDNASKFTLQEAAKKCADLKVPLHIYGAGSSEGALLQLKEVGAPDTMFVEDNVTIPVHWRAQGFTEGKIEITISLGGVVRARKEMKELQTGEDLRAVLGFAVPNDLDTKREHDLVTTIQYRSGGKVLKQDSMQAKVRVADTKIKVLFIENLPRWEFKFLQAALLRDRRILADFILVSADPEVTKKKDPTSPYLPEFYKMEEEFRAAKYNLIILGDVPAKTLDKEKQEWLRKFVENGGGLIVIAGRQNMPNSYEKADKEDKGLLADMLPVEFTKQKFGIDTETRSPEYPPALTEAGQRADWLALADTPEQNLEVWQEKLRPLGFHWYFPITKLRPGATALIVNKRAKLGEFPMPIMATRYHGKGQVVWLGTDETWRWRWNYEDKYFGRFWGQMVYQLGLPSLLGNSAKRAQMALDRSKAVVGKQSTLYVRLLDKEYNPRKDKEVDAELVYLEAKTKEDRKLAVKLQAIKGQPGDYRVDVQNNHEGRHELHVRNPELKIFPYRVELPPRHEREESGLAEHALRDAARISNGHFYREEDLHQLSSNLERPVRMAKFTRHQEVLLWNPLALLVFLGLITTEWLVRKYSDLS